MFTVQAPMNANPDRLVSRRDTSPSVGPPPDAYQSNLGLGVLLSGDLAPSTDILPGDPTDDCPLFDDDTTGAKDEGTTLYADDAEFGEGRRGYGRYRLASNYIRVAIYRDDHKQSHGRMTNASVTGLFVRCQNPLPFKAIVRVEWCLINDIKMSFTGRVVRSTKDGMAIHLTTDDANWRFRASFIDRCRIAAELPPSVTIRRLTPSEAKRYMEDDTTLRQLGIRWKRVERDLSNDALHQAFIQDCLKQKRLQFALERYRELQTWPVDGFDATEYLKQIGTILSFYQLQPATTVEATTLRRYLPIVVIIVLMVLTLLGVPYLLGNRVTPHP